MSERGRVHPKMTNVPSQGVSSFPNKQGPTILLHTSTIEQPTLPKLVIYGVPQTLLCKGENLKEVYADPYVNLMLIFTFFLKKNFAFIERIS
jgi:hypothetical protein